jgi:sensor histidine kinase YesM
VGVAGLYSHYLVILASLWCFAATCFILIMVHRRTHAEYELKYSEKALTAAYNHYKALSNSLDEAEKLRHDIKYILSAIQELALENNGAEIVKLLKGSPDYRTKRLCEHHIINALVNWYAQRCENHNIALDFHLFIPNDIAVDATELCVVLGNLLENAFENCLNAHDSRYIRIYANTEPHTLMINILNSFDGKVNAHRGELQTRKDAGGIGLRSIQSVCKKYNGECMTSWSGNEFSVAVYLNFANSDIHGQ